MAVFGGWRLTRAGIFFVIGILVLGGLVTGGIFLVKNHGEAVRRDQATKIAEQNLKDQSQTAAHPATATGSNNAGGTDKTGTNTSTTNTSTTDTSANGTSSTTATNNASQLPVTGINDLQFIGQAAILALLALSAAYYVSSRRAARAL